MLGVPHLACAAPPPPAATVGVAASAVEAEEADEEGDADAAEAMGLWAASSSPPLFAPPSLLASAGEAADSLEEEEEGDIGADASSFSVAASGVFAFIDAASLRAPNGLSFFSEAGDASSISAA